MRTSAALAAALLCVAAPIVTAAYPAGIDAVTGARPGNVIGTGSSLPLSSHASNIGPYDTRSNIAPRLPAPPVGPDASPEQYLRAARQALV